MDRFRWGFLGACIASAAFACSSSKPAPLTSIDSSSLCDKLVNTCNDTTVGTVDQCVGSFKVFRVTTQCANDLKNASCEDLSSPTSKLFLECFPSCPTAHTYNCNGNGTVTECNEGVDGGANEQATLDCADVCDTESQKYSGTCGTSFGTQMSDHAVCWCE